MKKQIKIDDARDMVLKLDLDQADKLLGFLQFHRKCLRSMAITDIKIGDIVVTQNGDIGHMSRNCGKVVDIDNRDVTIYPNRRRFDKRIGLRKLPVRWVRKVA